MPMSLRQYEIWHDESKINGYHHGILLIPLDKKDALIDLIKKIRDEHKYKYHYDLKYAGAKDDNSKGRLISNMLDLFTHIIQTRIIQPTKIFNPSKKDRFTKKYTHYLDLKELYDCRFGLLKMEDKYEIKYFRNYENKIETTLSYILKGCCHGMFSNNTPIEIVKFYFDGDKHHKSNIDIQGVLGGAFRDYCKISNDIAFDARHMKDRNDDTKLLMNLVDNVTGAWRSIINKEVNKKRLTRPLHEIATRILQNKIYKNINSRWYKSINISEFKINDFGQIEFPDIFRNDQQQCLF